MHAPPSIVLPSSLYNGSPIVQPDVSTSNGCCGVQSQNNNDVVALGMIASRDLLAKTDIAHPAHLNSVHLRRGHRAGSSLAKTSSPLHTYLRMSSLYVMQLSDRTVMGCGVPLKIFDIMRSPFLFLPKILKERMNTYAPFWIPYSTFLFVTSRFGDGRRLRYPCCLST